LEISDATHLLIERASKLGTLRLPVVEGYWETTDLLEANRLILDNIETRLKVRSINNLILPDVLLIEKGTRVVNSKIRVLLFLEKIALSKIVILAHILQSVIKRLFR